MNTVMFSRQKQAIQQRAIHCLGDGAQQVVWHEIPHIGGWIWIGGC